MTAVLKKKPIKVVATSGVNDLYGGIELNMYIGMVLEEFAKKPMDLYVFAYKNGKLTMRANGYDFSKEGTKEYVEEDFECWRSDSLEVKTFWCKIDDHGEEYVATFLFPEEY